MHATDIENFSDQELVIMLKKGDRCAFEELFKRYSDKTYHLALRITRSSEEAEEVIQETFIKVYNSITSFQGKSAFSSWLYRITFNSALMNLRKNKKHQALVSTEDLQCKPAAQLKLSVCNEKLMQNFELREFLLKAINNLPEQYRSIYIMRDIDGLSNQDVSDLKSISIPAVKSRLHRARIMLQAALKKHYCNTSQETAIEIESDLAA